MQHPHPEPVVFSVAFRGLSPLRKVLSALIDDPRLWLNNDYDDVLVPGPEVADRLRRDPGHRFGLPDWYVEEWTLEE